MVLSSAGIVRKKNFAWPLSPLISVSAVFGPGDRFRNPVLFYLSALIFTLLFLAMFFIATLGVFVRTTIDTWIQFSLYVVPLISLVCGFQIYRSQAFNTLLERKLGRRSAVRMFAEPEIAGQVVWHESHRGAWLRKSALKNCIYPFAMEIYQWVAYFLFRYVYKAGDHFAGSWKEKEIQVVLTIDDETWLGLYGCFWVVAVYITGFVAYSFILVARLTTRDAISFMCRFGDGPFLPYRPTLREFSKAVHAEGPSFLKRLLHSIIGFLTFDLLDTGKDIVLIYEQDTDAEAYRYRDSMVGKEGEVVPHNGLDLDPEVDIEDSLGMPQGRSSSISVPRTPKIEPSEACKCLTNLVANLEGLATAFQPFIILLTFFAVANFVTHIAAIVIRIKGFEETHWWTFTRTLFWLFLSLRLMWSVASITRILAHIPLHVDYLRSIGQLQGEDKDWDGFLRLTNTFQLRTRTYGFPLTLKQVAYCATFLNFAFLIVLSVIQPSSNHH